MPGSSRFGWAENTVVGVNEAEAFISAKWLGWPWNEGPFGLRPPSAGAGQAPLLLFDATDRGAARRLAYRSINLRCPAAPRGLARPPRGRRLQRIRSGFPVGPPGRF